MDTTAAKKSEPLAYTQAVLAGLGRDCQVSYQLRKSGCLSLPMPFDSMVTPLPALRRVLDERLRGLEARKAWEVRGRTLVHRDLSMSVGHLRFEGKTGAILARARLGVTASVLRNAHHLGVSPIFIRLAESPAELDESDTLLQLLGNLTPRPRLVHVGHAGTGSEWCERGDALVHATVPPGTTWRGDATGWRRLLARVGAWSGHKIFSPSAAVANVAASLAPFAWGSEWSRLVDALSEVREEAARVNVDPLLVAALIAAEDHRFFRHSGIDFLRTLRAGSEWLLGRRAGGGSTIEQQLVRVTTGHMERTLSRKVREILAAAAVGSILSKSEVAKSYLLTGYFGRGMRGLNGASRALGFDYSSCTAEEAANLVSCMKYPWSPDAPPRWTARRKERAKWIALRLQ
jgi:penicillin-binding protein 1A